MNRFIFIILTFFVLAGQGWGATYYVSPIGDGTDATSGNYTEAKATLREAIALATLDGDVIILQKSLLHNLTASGGLAAELAANITIRNEDDDELYNECVVNVPPGSGIKNTTAADDSLTIKGITFQNGAYTSVSTATAFLNTSGSTNVGPYDIIGCRFSNFTNTDGGEYGTLFKMYSGSAGQAIFKLTRCEIDNSSTGVNYGDLVYIQGFDVTIDDLKYHDNGKTTGEGGTFRISTLLNGKNIISTLSGLTWYNNINVRSGPVGDGTLNFGMATSGLETHSGSVTDSVFTNNTAGAGGAIYCSKNTMITMLRNSFVSNYSHGDGGAVRRGGQDDDEITGWTKILYSEFINNESGQHGGAIDIFGSASRSKWAEIYNCTFRDNTAGGLGQSIHGYNAHDLVTQKSKIQNSIFVGVITEGKYHIYGGGGDVFSIIDSNYVEGGEGSISDSGATITNMKGSYPIAGATIVGVHDQATAATDLLGNSVLILPPMIGTYENRTSLTVATDDYAPTGYTIRAGATLVYKGDGHLDLSGLTDTGAITVKLNTTGLNKFTPNGATSTMRPTSPRGFLKIGN